MRRIDVLTPCRFFLGDAVNARRKPVGSRNPGTERWRGGLSQAH
jgi:hypothetical protein